MGFQRKVAHRIGRKYSTKPYWPKEPDEIGGWVKKEAIFCIVGTVIAFLAAALSGALLYLILKGIGITDIRVENPSFSRFTLPVSPVSQFVLCGFGVGFIWWFLIRHFDREEGWMGDLLYPLTLALVLFVPYAVACAGWAYGVIPLLR